TDTTDTTTGMMGDPYGPCPNGDGDCLPGEVCHSGSQNGNDYNFCTSGECNGNNDCGITPDDACANPPGDGSMNDFCVPATCDMQNPCPIDGMICVGGFNGGVCAWPG
ncbi:MAG: hypothetical protein KC431_25300, partial [Myxococcales bacterium]|nr:hypothetical protein [Myxococcales bacterium]